MKGDFSYLRYLEAKRSVDDRAINRVVFDTLRKELPADRPLRVLEIGGGTGSMVRRSILWSLLPEAEYHLVDADSEAIANLPALLGEWAKTQTETSCKRIRDGLLHLASPEASLRLQLEKADIGEYLEACEHKYDLIIANAVLDLMNLPTLLPKLWTRCSTDALYWFTINFDGESVFLPALDEDAEIFEAYHASMDRRSGSRHTGRRLFAELGDSGASILESGSSDWVVHPGAQGYREEEAYFLHHIVHTIDLELDDKVDLSQGNFRAWIRERHRQIEEGGLVYLAHQLDFVGRCAGESQVP